MSKDPIIEKLLEHDEQFEEIRKDIKETKDEILTRLDKNLNILQRLDHERIFTNETIKRMQKEIEHQQKEINKIKRVLKIA
ncbi:MAG: hypothetical protein M1536_01655 [Firmicutes bacterium]|nr:hypothetical protein [Bacillota bacterium]